jgi:hypothetical protein
MEVRHQSKYNNNNSMVTRMVGKLAMDTGNRNRRNNNSMDIHTETTPLMGILTPLNQSMDTLITVKLAMGMVNRLRSHLRHNLVVNRWTKLNLHCA